MTHEEKSSLARVKRAARIAQRAVDVLGGMERAYVWLSAPCPALRGKAPGELRYDVAACRRALSVLRYRERRMRAIEAAASGSFSDEDAFSAWLWSRCHALNDRLPAMLLDTDRGAREVIQALPADRDRERRFSGRTK